MIKFMSMNRKNVRFSGPSRFLRLHMRPLRTVLSIKPFNCNNNPK
jgi:hypothetical protein